VLVHLDMVVPLDPHCPLVSLLVYLDVVVPLDPHYSLACLFVLGDAVMGMSSIALSIWRFASIS